MITDRLSINSNYVELEGDSQDNKPTEGIGVNSRFYELDTNDAYYFDGSKWVKIGSVTD